jgi:hypothetical protein
MNGLSHRPVATDELRGALEDALADRAGTRRRVVRLARRPSPYRTSCALDELDVRLDDGVELALLFKDLSREALAPVAARAKPRFLLDPRREIEVYRRVLAPRRLGTAVFHGAVVEPARRRYWLFLERVPAVALYEVGDAAVWCRAAAWLAGLHGELAAAAGGLAGPARLLRYDARYYRRWPRRAAAFVVARCGTASHPTARRLARLAERYEPVVERLLALPTTLLHGEPYASNVLVRGDAGDARICPIDWEMAAVGPGLVDLAALTSGRWPEERRAELALAYHAALPPDGGWAPSPAELLDALEWCRLHLAMQWLGWAPDWAPPPEHAHDWLGEALSLADRLGL